MIEIINEIEALGLYWSLRTRVIEPKDYHAVIWFADGSVGSSDTSPALALANTLALARREFGLPARVERLARPEPGTVYPRGSQGPLVRGPSMGTGEQLPEARDLDPFHHEPL